MVNTALDDWIVSGPLMVHMDHVTINAETGEQRNHKRFGQYFVIIHEARLRWICNNITDSIFYEPDTQVALNKINNLISNP